MTLKKFHDSTELSKGRINKINRVLVKFFVACEMSFKIIEHSFFIDFVKKLNTTYAYICYSI